MIRYENIQTDGIRSSFDKNSKETDYSYKVDINSDVLKEIDPTIETFFNDLKTLSPEAYNKFSIGEFAIKAKADVNVQTFAFAYGITDRLTVYAGVPYYKASVKMDYNHSKYATYDEVAQIIHQNGNTDLDGTYEYIISEVLPNISGQNLQYILTNYLGYNPAGDWYGEGYGDSEIGAMYRLTESANYGAVATFGLIAPTGVVDDRASLQDIPFGDGQWDIFGEIGAGIIYKAWTFSSSFRYDHQFANTFTLRAPEDVDFPLSSNSKDFSVKLGDKIIYQIGTNYTWNDWLGFYGGYIFDYQFQTEIDSGDRYVDSILEQNTEGYAHSLKFSTTFDTVKLFKLGKFAIPTQTDISVRSMLSGQNTPKVSRLTLMFRMFF